MGSPAALRATLRHFWLMPKWQHDKNPLVFKRVGARSEDGVNAGHADQDSGVIGRVDWAASPIFFKRLRFRGSE